MANDFLRRVAVSTAGEVVRKHLAWLPHEQHDALRAALQDAILAGLEATVARYEHANKARPQPAPESRPPAAEGVSIPGGPTRGLFAT